MRAWLNTYRDSWCSLPEDAKRLCIGSFVQRSMSMVIPFLTLYLTTRMGFSVKASGLALGAYGFGAALGALFGGWASDRWPPERVLAISLAATGLGLWFMGSLENRTALLVFLPIQGFVAEWSRPSQSSALVASAGPEHLNAALAVRRFAVNLAMSIGPVLGGFLAEANYRWLFWVDGSASLAALPVIWPLVTRGLQSRDEHHEDGGSIGRPPWQDRPYLVFVLLTSLFCLLFFQGLSTVPLTFRDHYALTESRIGLVFAINTVIILLFEIPVMRRFSAVPPLKVLVHGVWLTGVGYALLPLGHEVWLACLAVSVWTWGEILFLPFAEWFASSRATRSHRGRYLSWFSLAFTVAFVTGPVLGTFLYEKLGVSLLWFGSLPFCLLLSLGFLLLQRWMPQVAAPHHPS